MNKIYADIDIDVKRKSDITDKFHCVEAVQDIGEESNTIHQSGVYFQDIPLDPIMDTAAIPYKQAEELGYQKIDFLNNHAYNNISSREEMEELINKPVDWNMLMDDQVVSELYHLNKNFSLLQKKLPKSIRELALFLAVLRPGKKHLFDMNWDEMESNGIWDIDQSEGYCIKKAHAFAYAHLIIMQMNKLASLL